MLESISDYLAVLKQAAQTLNQTAADEDVKTAATSIFGWLKKAFSGKSKPQQAVEQAMQDPEKTGQLEGPIEHGLDDEQREELKAKLLELKKVLPHHTEQSSQITVSGDNNIVVGNTSNSQINIGKTDK